jgi:hypothetical protein
LGRGVVAGRAASERRPDHLKPMAVQYPQRMSEGLRWAVYVTFGALWASGCYWLVLHYLFARETDFGLAQHPWGPMVLRVHGWIAVGSVFLLGWITARHVSDRWPQVIKRVSGLAIASVAAVLAVTGYALYYTNDVLHDDAGTVHQFIGAVAVLLALTHWRRHRPRRQRSVGARRRGVPEHAA